MGVDRRVDKKTGVDAGSPVVVNLGIYGATTALSPDTNRSHTPTAALREMSAGAAASLDELVNFYDQRFQMNLSDKEKQQLVAFLQSL
jgi:hypothetical protein